MSQRLGQRLGQIGRHQTGGGGGQREHEAQDHQPRALAGELEQSKQRARGARFGVGRLRPAARLVSAASSSSGASAQGRFQPLGQPMGRGRAADRIAPMASGPAGPSNSSVPKPQRSFARSAETASSRQERSCGLVRRGVL